MTTYPALDVVSSELATTTIQPHGATLIAWQPRGADPVIFLSSAAVFAPGAAIRGGVPICFPWFGAGRTGDRAPAHGPARLVTWRRVESAGAPPPDEHLASELTETDLAVNAEPYPGFPGPFTARYDIHTGSELDLAFTVTNRAAHAIDYELALHTYLFVGDVEQIVIEGLEEAPYLDKAAGRIERSADHEPLRIAGEVDRVYRSTRTVTVVDPVLRRTLVVGKEHSATTIVWNPGATKAAAMTDLGAGDWRRFVCVEAGNVGDAAVRLEPGERHTLTYRLRIEPLS